ncbi:sulfatase-like hydrolase/transferase [Stieleria sp. TO1_6]|uniref:sulfatase-like hydrolase/transferase n=1 Tax=Stieleria tagensis TaxID=2956795 RepID=UPI00209B3BB1|nr:sulfatase-like hydrolase/transferase [Stieleria tagensis]MCO8124567.1 sulfatase-like hydrolase/transferase [Stieleria tagensis]
MTLLILLLLVSILAAPATADDSTPANILLIVADDLGFSDLGCYGGEIDTPNLDQLAQNGLRLTQFYTTGRCCPSRASLLTGQYPHRVGLGHMTQDIGQPGYRGRIAEGAQTIAEQLAKTGYRSFLSGKWHLGTDDPTRHGFEEFYGTLTSAKTFWDADHFLRLPAGRRTKSYDDGDFYATEAVADHAIEFLNLARQTPDTPWFVYLAMNAPHFPLHAPKELIAKYSDRYASGWDVARSRRLEQMKKLGVVPLETQLTPRSVHFDWGASEPDENPPWNSLSKDRRTDLSRRMAIYAAMVDSMDQNIGRVIAELKRRGEFENTLILFTSDNGACAEWDPFGFDGKSGPSNVLHRDDQLDAMGAPGTFHSAGSGWANVSNTPWRLYKHYNHEGGIAVPCIVHWPSKMAGKPSGRGQINQTPFHLIDVLPTLLDAAGATAANQDADLPGTSILPILDGNPLPERGLFFEHEGNRAVRNGKWKLVALRQRPWELYNFDNDRTELNDLAVQHPEIVHRLSKAWDHWAAENHVTPLPDDYHVAYVPNSRKTHQDGSPQLMAGPVRKLADGFRFTEGPAWDGTANWYFSDIPNKTIQQFSADGKVTSIRKGKQASNGIVVDDQGRLVFCEIGGRRIVRRAVDGSEETIADSCDGKPLGMPNDIWIAPTGDLYFTIPRTKQQRASAVPENAVDATVCIIPADGSPVRNVGIGLKSPNGIVGSRDGKRLYVTDFGAKKCWRYMIQADGSLTDQQLAAGQGSDGIAIDEQGNVYTTSKEGITVYSAQARQIGFLPIPESPANMKFGGRDGRTLFVTARKSIYSLQMQIRGDIQ